MEAKNFRIGNLIYWDIPEKNGVIHEITRIMFNRVNTTPISLGDDMSEYKPIVLTDSWLVQFGFKNVGGNFEKDWLILHKNIKTGTIDFLLNEPTSGKYHATILKYVHELQNLFFAITGTELELEHECSTCG